MIEKEESIKSPHGMMIKQLILSVTHAQCNAKVRTAMHNSYFRLLLRAATKALKIASSCAARIRKKKKKKPGEKMRGSVRFFVCVLIPTALAMPVRFTRSEGSTSSICSEMYGFMPNETVSLKETSKL